MWKHGWARGLFVSALAVVALDLPSAGRAREAMTAAVATVVACRPIPTALGQAPPAGPIRSCGVPGLRCQSRGGWQIMLGA